MRKLFLAVLLLAGQVHADRGRNAWEFHKELDRCFESDKLLCVAHVLVDAIFASKDGGGGGGGHEPGGRAFTVEFFERATNNECTSYSIVKFSLVHNDPDENLRRCAKLDAQYGNVRAAYCQKIDGVSQVIRGAWIGNACKDLAYQ